MIKRPRLVVAGLSGGSGKTIVSLGLTRALSASGRRVKPFKKGPDYIDAAWLGLAAGRSATNLDTFLFSPDKVRDLFIQTSYDGLETLAPFLSIIEGNRGLFDGGDTAGSHSTSELARLLQAPVVLVIDCTKMTRTVAAIIQGCTGFEPGLKLAGVVLNQTAGERHRTILRQAIEKYTDVPVLGMLPKLKPDPIPERHMGLTPDSEYAGEAVLDRLAAVMREHVDLEAVAVLADSAPAMDMPSAPLWQLPFALDLAGEPPVIGVVKDAALWFYYPENLDGLRNYGASIETVSLLSDEPWPEIHGLYLGGGFPETQAAALAANSTIRNHVRRLADQGMPIYAECGGFMYLCEELKIGETRYPMAGVFPVSTELKSCPQGLGYVEAEVVADNPFLPKGLQFHGHEFHYSCCTHTRPDLQDAGDFVLRLSRGSGMSGSRDGLLHKSTFAAYTHLHALGVPQWAERFVAAARAWRDEAR